MRWKLLASLALLGLLVIFSVQNYEVVQLRFLVWQIDMSRAILLFLVLAFGIGIGWTLATLRRPTRSKKIDR